MQSVPAALSAFPECIFMILFQDYEDEEEEDEDDDEDTGMGDEGDDSNEGTGSADGNDGYEADDAEVRLVPFYSLLNYLEEIGGVMRLNT